MQYLDRVFSFCPSAVKQTAAAPVQGWRCIPSEVAACGGTKPEESLLSGAAFEAILKPAPPASADYKVLVKTTATCIGLVSTANPI